MNHMKAGSTRTDPSFLLLIGCRLPDGPERRWYPRTLAQGALHFVRMKRTNLVLNEQLLEEATRLSGERTYSRTVERALEEFVRRVKARQILELAGSGLWEGELSAVREDRGVYRTKQRGSR